jgi:hypothetical protein
MVVMVVIAPAFPRIGGVGGVGGKKRMVVFHSSQCSVPSSQFPVRRLATCYLLLATDDLPLDMVVMVVIAPAFPRIGGVGVGPCNGGGQSVPRLATCYSSLTSIAHLFDDGWNICLDKCPFFRAQPAPPPSPAVYPAGTS